jgi:hypothetical protein
VNTEEGQGGLGRGGEVGRGGGEEEEEEEEENNFKRILKEKKRRRFAAPFSDHAPCRFSDHS